MLEKMKIYWIGGSPCCGKSTISEMLVKEFGFEMYKCDDHLDRYTEIGFENGVDIMKKVKPMSMDETWLRDVDELVEDEFEFYKEALKIIVTDLERDYQGKTVLVEGAAILPEFIKELGVENINYVSIAPTKKFQLEKYSQREWVKYYLAECSDPIKAFDNWMERDARYAERVTRDAKQFGLNAIVVDGNKTIEENYLDVKRMFGLL